MISNSVCVNLHNLPGFEDFQHCIMDGILLDTTNGHYRVLLCGIEKEVRVGLERLFEQQSLEPNVKWKTGDAVQVLEKNDGISGWWSATILEDLGEFCRIRWVGRYRDFPDVTIVKRDVIRRGFLNRNHCGAKRRNDCD